MRITAVCLLVLSLALSTMECTAGQTYMKFTKYSTYYANEETWEIYDGSTKIYTSPVLANSQYRIIETCLSSSTNDQYTLKLKDSYGDSWSAGSVLFVDGLYGNVMFKGYLTDNNEETYTLSLYTPVKKQDQWKLTSGTISGTWTEGHRLTCKKSNSRSIFYIYHCIVLVTSKHISVILGDILSQSRDFLKRSCNFAAKI